MIKQIVISRRECKKEDAGVEIVVTGATSFLARPLVGRLLAMGHQVYAVVRPGSSNLELLKKEAGDNPGLRLVELEMERFDRLDSVIGRSCGLFFHFGWDGSGSENRKNAVVQQRNAENSVKAFLAAERLGCGRFIFSGSQAEYGICDGEMTEETVCSPVSEYGRAKLAFGRQAFSLAEQRRRSGVSEMVYIHTRIFSVYGPGDHEGSLVNTCLKTFAAGRTMELGDCARPWNYLYIDDLVEGLLALAFCEKAAGGVYNLAGDRSATRPLRDYVEEMHALCGGRGSCAYGKLPPNAEGAARLAPSIDKITAVTGWKPRVRFEEGIRRMLAQGERKRTQCLICGRELPAAALMRFEGMPASAQDIPGPGDLAADHGIGLGLYQCPSCGLVQLDCEPVAYYREVIRSGGYTTTMARLRREQYSHLIQRYHLEGKKFLEVGCGRGEFLQMLGEFAVDAYGIEQRRELADTARASGLQVFDGFTETADTVLGDKGPYDVFLSFNFLEHQPEPGVMLTCIRNNLSDSGMGLITVPSLEYILQYDGYYELIRDHIAYYTFETLRYLLERNGFAVLEEEVVNRDTLAVIVQKTGEVGACNPAATVRDCGLKEQTAAGSNAAARPLIPVDVSGWKESYERICSQLLALAADCAAQGHTLAVWGASHQGFTLAATTCLGEKAAYIIDSAPFKQGRFAPASHLPIVSPESVAGNPPDVILIAAPGYTEEIRGEIRRRYGEDIGIWTLRSEKLEELS